MKSIVVRCCKGGRWRFGKIEILLKMWIVFIIDQELINWSKGDKTHLLYTFSRSALNSKFILRFARNKVGLRIKKTVVYVDRKRIIIEEQKNNIKTVVSLFISKIHFE
jgi:hypothetical protein